MQGEERVKYMREYRIKNRRRLSEHKRLWYANKKTNTPIKVAPIKVTRKGRIVPEGKCQRCEILLSGNFAGAHDGVHCEDCLGRIS